MDLLVALEFFRIFNRHFLYGLKQNSPYNIQQFQETKKQQNEETTEKKTEINKEGYCLKPGQFISKRSHFQWQLVSEKIVRLPLSAPGLACLCRRKQFERGHGCLLKAKYS